jgi:7-cyano-7-deazaguanine reductase
MSINNKHFKPEHSELGKQSNYQAIYNPNILLALPRTAKRKEIGINPNDLPFYGFDRWNHYEVSWLNEKGKPIVALAEIIYKCNSPNIIESKSMKLYFNSFNNTKFANTALVELTITKDLEEHVGSQVFVKINPIYCFTDSKVYRGFNGICIDELDVECFVYTVDSSSLLTEDQEVTEIIYSDLLKSNCLITNQPDWGSIQITYKGKRINHTGLLQYIVSFRNHNEFHEQCIERIFVDIMQYCQPSELSVHGRYTRRGGIDINPYRSTNDVDLMGNNKRLCRQ